MNTRLSYRTYGTPLQDGPSGYYYKDAAPPGLSPNSTSISGVLTGPMLVAEDNFKNDLFAYDTGSSKPNPCCFA